MMHSAHSSPEDRLEFLVDGCPRCEQYVDDLGIFFTPDRFRAFWRKMVEVEFDNEGGYHSVADRHLGRKLYLFALAFQRAYGIDPADFDRINRSFASYRDLGPHSVRSDVHEEIAERLLISNDVRFLLDGLGVESISELKSLVDLGRAGQEYQSSNLFWPAEERDG